jgi:transposase
MRPIPIEVRKMIVAAKNRGEKIKTIALWTGYTPKSIYNICKLEEERRLEPKPFTGRRSILTDEQLKKNKANS